MSLVDTRSTTNPRGHLTRRQVLDGIVTLGVIGISASAASAQAARHEVTIEFEDCHTAVLTGVRATETLTVYYTRREGTRLAQYDIPSTETELYSIRPLLVRYDPHWDRTTVRLAARGSLVRVVAENGIGARTARTNEHIRCSSAGVNSPPTAAFAATTVDRSGCDTEPLVVTTAEDVTFSSTATDPDLPTDRLRHEWDLDGDGLYEVTGARVTTTYVDAGTVVVSHRVVDDFDETSVATRTVAVRRPWRLHHKFVPDSLHDGDQFGIGVLLTNDTLVTSGPGDDDKGPNAGAAYVFRLTDPDRPPTKLTPATLHSGDLAGLSMAVSDALLAISAVHDDERGDAAGAVYVYDLADFARTPKKVAPTLLRAHDYLGLSLAALDDTLVAGAHLDDELAHFAGSLFVFDLTDVEAPPTKLVPAGLRERDMFGISVAVTDDWIVGGAIGDDELGAQAGAVYVYDRADLSRPPRKLTPEGLSAGDQFGRPLTALGDTLAVGTAFDDERGTQAGAVYVYDLRDLSRQPTKLAPCGLLAGDLFGYAVALSEETLVVGAIGDDTVGADAGAVYVFDLRDLTLPPTKLAPDELAPGDLFGFSVTASNGRLAAGAVFDDDSGTDAGAVYVFER